MSETAASMLSAVMGEIKRGASVSTSPAVPSRPSSPAPEDRAPSPAITAEHATPPTLDAVAATVNKLVPTVNEHERLLQQLPTKPLTAISPVPLTVPASGQVDADFNLASFFLA